MTHYDLAVAGAGIVGLAHALAAVKRGKRVLVIERDARAVGASIRNFGFVTVTGQRAGRTWERAMRSRDIWDEIAPAAVDNLILDCANEVLDIPNPRVIERWTGVYACSNERLMLVDQPGDAVRIVIITSGTGASTAFAIGEEVIADLFDA